MGLKLIIPAGIGSPSTPAEPITLEEAQNHIRVSADITSDDSLIEALITSARMFAENHTNRVCLTQTWELVLDAFPVGILELPKAPLQSVSSITYIDSNGAQQTLAASAYKVDAVTNPGRIAPAYGTVWPVTRNEANAVTITFIAGYGDQAANVPAPIRQAMLLMIAHLYDNRAAVEVGGDFYKLPLGVEALLAQYRVIRWE
ncbi:MAG: head-tail connector protein [Sterolibacterium sp.]